MKNVKVLMREQAERVIEKLADKLRSGKKLDQSDRKVLKAVIRKTEWWEPEGWTVAHEMAKRGFVFTDPEILKLADKGGYTVAHEMADKGYAFTDFEILKLADESGRTVAHIMAEKGHVFTDPEVLKLADKNGWTVAHEMAKYCHVFDDPEVLKLADQWGWTVAHEMAKRGYVFTDPEVLNLKDRIGTTVKMIIERYYKKPLEEVLKKALAKDFVVKIRKKILGKNKKKMRI